MTPLIEETAASTGMWWAQRHNAVFCEAQRGKHTRHGKAWELPMLETRAQLLEPYGTSTGQAAKREVVSAARMCTAPKQQQALADGRPGTESLRFDDRTCTLDAQHQHPHKVLPTILPTKLLPSSC